MKISKTNTALIFIHVMLIATISRAQNSGYIRYEEKVDQHRQLPPEMEAMKANIPQFSTTIYRLYFTPTESSYQGYQEDRPMAPQGGFGGGQGFGGPGGGPRPPQNMNPIFVNLNNQFYTNEEMMVSQVEFFGQNYFFNDTLKMAGWKFGEGTRTILGYECKLAYYTDTTTPDKPLEITAWYTSKIRPFIGPERYNTLPGGILALDINGGEHYWVARKVELRELTTNEKVMVPEEKKKSKRISYPEFEAERELQNKQMRERFRGRG